MLSLMALPTLNLMQRFLIVVPWRISAIDSSTCVRFLVYLRITCQYLKCSMNVNTIYEPRDLPVIRRYTSPKGGGSVSPSAVQVSNMTDWRVLSESNVGSLEVEQ